MNEDQSTDDTDRQPTVLAVRASEDCHLIESIDASGDIQFWVIDPTRPPSAGHGTGCNCPGCVPEHERLGPLPHKVWPRCSAVKRNGEQCRSAIATWTSEFCRVHGGAS